MIDSRPHEIVHKETGRVIGIYASFDEAYKEYEKLGSGPEGMTDHAIGLVNQKVSE
jgi:hypothetical protein